MAADPPCVLIVDDDADIRQMLAVLLTDAGYTVDTAANGRDALARVQAGPPQLVLLDLQMPGMTGAEVLHTLRENGRRLPVALVSVYGTRALAAAREHGAD